MNKLSIELVPSTSFFKNLRSEVTKEKWDNIRRDCYRKASYVCEICGDKGDHHPVECHEIWEYDDKNHIQKLIGLISLCPACHSCKHIGLSKMRGLEEECIEHLMKVNSISRKKVEEMIKNAFEKWGERSKYNWKIDISKISEIK